MTDILEESVFVISQVTADLLHPFGIRTRRNACNVHTSRLQVHNCQDIEGDQSPTRPDFDGGDVRGETRIPVSFQERGVRWRSGAGSMPCAFNTFPTVESAI